MRHGAKDHGNTKVDTRNFWHRTIGSLLHTFVFIFHFDLSVTQGGVIKVLFGHKGGNKTRKGGFLAQIHQLVWQGNVLSKLMMLPRVPMTKERPGLPGGMQISTMSLENGLNYKDGILKIRMLDGEGPCCRFGRGWGAAENFWDSLSFMQWDPVCQGSNLTSTPYKLFHLGLYPNLHFLTVKWVWESWPSKGRCEHLNGLSAYIWNIVPENPY